MNPSDPPDTDLVTLLSEHGATDTAERLKPLLVKKGIELFAHIDPPREQRRWGCRCGRLRC